ncbi:MAG: TetR/AcrR family transcriptional regulator [Firmicutes bacterium]|nr:TetR/AcrR family transcriptional regulator [Bacillota bacterium]
MEDRRALKTKKLIKKTFLDLLKTNPISKISVSEITRLADIGRGTFYFHYLDVYDLQDKIENEICDDLLMMFDETYKTTADFKLLFFAIIDYISENGELFSLLAVQQASGSHLMQKIRQIFVNKISALIPEKYIEEHHKIRILFVVSGVVGVIDDLVRKGSKVEKEMISHELSKMMSLLEQGKN